MMQGKKCAKLLLLVLAFLLALGASALAAETVSLSEAEGVSLRLYRNQPQDSAAFSVDNMFPGDAVSRAFFLELSHKDAITLHFRAELRPGSEKLAEVLMCRVAIRGGDTLYDGPMDSLPETLDVALPAREDGASDLVYDITAYLSTAVGNDYMSQALHADLIWWVDAPESLVEPPKTGDSDHALLWLCAACAASAALWRLTRRKGGHTA